MSGLAGFAGKGVEPGKAGLKEETDPIGGPVALFGDIEFAGKSADIGGQGLRFALLGLGTAFGLARGGFPAEKKDEIGILFDRARLAKVVQGGFGIIFLGFTIELSEDDDWNLEFHGEGFEATGYFGNLDLPVFFAPTGAGGEKLEVIDDQNIDAVLFFDPAGTSPKLADGEQAGLIQKEGEIGDLGGHAAQSGDLAFAEMPAADLLRIEAGVRGEKSEHELLGGHFQSEERDIVARADKIVFFQVVALAEHVAGHAEGEGGFADTWAGGENDHFPGFEARGELIQLIKAGGNPAVVTFASDKIFDQGNRLGSDLGCAQDPFRFPATANFENIALRFVEDGLDLMGTFVGTDHDLGAGLLEFAQETFVLDLFEVSLGGEDADDPGGEVADEGRAPRGIGQFAVGQPSEESRGVNRLATFPHFGDATEDDLVGGVKEVLFAHSFFAGEVHDLVGVGQHGAE